MGYIATQAAKAAILQCGTVEQLTIWRAGYDAAIKNYPNMYTQDEKDLIEGFYQYQLEAVNSNNQKQVNPPTPSTGNVKDAIIGELKDYDGMTIDDLQNFLTPEEQNLIFSPSTTPMQRKQLMYNAYSLWNESKTKTTASKANPEVAKPHISLFGQGSITSQIEKQTGETINKWVQQNTTKVPGQGGNVEDPKPKNVTSVTKPAESTDSIAPVLGIGDVIFIAGGIAVAVFILHAIVAH